FNFHIRVWCQIVGDSPRKGDHAGASPVTLTILLRCRLTSRTADFESVNGGASPPAAAIFRVASFNSEAAGSYPAELGALPRRPTILARWRSSLRISLIRRRPRVRLPLEPPFFSKRGRAANAARCKRDALTGY